MSDTKTVYLISGANRGIGFALTQALSSRPDHVVYAGVRNPDSASALKSLSQSSNGDAVKIIKLTSGSVEDAQLAVKQIESEQGHVNTVIANAGITLHEAEAKTKDVESKYILEHFNINTLGPLVLYQAVYPLLKKAPKGSAKFITISSRLGSQNLAEEYKLETIAYGISKTAVNMLMRKTHFETEQEGFTVFPICPNWTQTEMGNGSATKHGMKEAPVKLEDSITGMLSVFDSATRETHGGRFWSEKGELLPF